MGRDVGSSPRRTTTRLTAGLTGALLVLGLLAGVVPESANAHARAATPLIKGWVATGHTVRANPRAATWRPKAARFGYQWLADGHAIKGATQPAYTIPARLAGKRLRVRVTGRRGGKVVLRRLSAAKVVSRGIPAGPNPLAGYRWRANTTARDSTYPAWQAATGDAKAQLAKVALQPHVIWFTSADGDAASAARNVRSYIADIQRGDPDVLVQLAVFRQWPEGEGARDKPLTQAQQDAYRRWIDAVAAAIGTTPVAMVLEPDLALDATPNTAALRTADPAARIALVRYAAQVFSRLPRTTVYLDAGSADWLTIDKAKRLLIGAGVQFVRGFALGATHYSSVASEIDFGTELSAALAEAGYPGKRFVIDTADNGRPFTYEQYYAKHPKGFFDNAEPCRTATEVQCDTLGPKPTTDVTAVPGLDDARRARAARLVDAYLWFGRPWLVNQAAPFDRARTIAVARFTPYQ